MESGLFLLSIDRSSTHSSMNTHTPALALHGGAGTISRGMLSTAEENTYLDGLRLPLQEGWDLLRNGASSIDAVERVVELLEENPLFNAGAGSVFTHEGKHEMDASVMVGVDRSAGAVAGVSGVRSPVKLARLVMENSDHVLLAGEGALLFARSQDVRFESEEYFFNSYRFQQLERAREADRMVLDHSDITGGDEKKFGTVGAVACDQNGNLAAATSTGGMTNKRFGRVGDTPIPGAGIWADNRTCAVSCTGHGEYFMRSVAAYDLACLMEYRSLSLEEAARYLVQEKLTSFGAEGGLVAVDTTGSLVTPFNSEGMYRGVATADQFSVSIYAD